MKKKALIIISIIVILLIGVFALSINIYNNIANNTEISKEDAIAIALSNADVTEEETSRLIAYLNLDDLYKQYDIQFVANNFEYEYEIDATTGDILDASKERIGF